MSDYISEGTLAHIFTYLPVKSLLRFRCVCKAWKQLIDSPIFVQEHLAFQKPRFLIEYEEPDFIAVDPRTRLPLVDQLRRPLGIGQLAILGTLHGVVCLHSWRRYLLIWNPSMRKSTTISLPLDFLWDEFKNRRQSYGFWIDPSNTEFKIIILLFLIDDNDWRVILYSSIQRNWRAIPAQELGSWQSCHESAPLMIGGVAHWLGWCESENNDHGHKCRADVILSFDFRLEKFDFIEMTDVKYSPLTHPAPCCWQGTLSILCCEDSFPYRCDVYSRQEVSWVKMFSFKLFAPVVRVFGLLEGMEEMEENGRVLATIRDELSITRGHLVLYDTKSGCIRLKSGIRYCNDVYMAYDFVESLLFPQG